MNQKDYIKFQIEDLLFELETETSKIVKNKKTYDCWFLLDFYTTFKQKKPGCNVTFNQFMATLQENKRYIVVNQNNINQHILFVKNNYEKSVFDEIANARNSNNKREETKNNVNKTEERVKKPVEVNKAKNRYEDISDDESDDFRSIKIVMKNNVSNRNEYGYKGIGNKKQKTCVDNKQKKDILRTYNDYRTHMLDALEISSAFMITTFNQAMIKKYGVCFDFKKAKANKPKYTWGKLSLYLDDCNDIFERIEISNVTYYRRKDASAQFLIDKRKNAHLRKYTNDNKNNKYSLEILIVNIFPVKTTAKINEIERIFEIVYGVAIQNLIPESSFESFLYKCKSPNMILKGAKQDAKVTLIPTHSEEYNVYGDLAVHGNAIAQEDMIINKLTSVTEPEVATKSEDIAFNYEVPVKSADVFSCTDPDIATLLGKSDLNIPVMIQEVDDTHNLRLLFDKCAGSSYGLKREFFHLIQTINFSDDEYGFYNE